MFEKSFLINAAPTPKRIANIIENKPFVVGFIAMITVGLVSIISMRIFTELFL